MSEENGGGENAAFAAGVATATATQAAEKAEESEAQSEAAQETAEVAVQEASRAREDAWATQDAVSGLSARVEAFESALKEVLAERKPPAGNDGQAPAVAAPEKKAEAPKPEAPNPDGNPKKKRKNWWGEEK